MEGKDIRWRQRFENFEKSYQLLEKYSHQDIMTDLEKAGMIQLFEMTFELAWKVIKDYLEAQGFSIKSPREAIKQGFQIELLDNGHIWMDALENRNLTTHTYDESLTNKILIKIIEEYLPQIEKLYEKLLGEI